MWITLLKKVKHRRVALADVVFVEYFGLLDSLKKDKMMEAKKIMSRIAMTLLIVKVVVKHVIRQLVVCFDTLRTTPTFLETTKATEQV